MPNFPTAMNCNLLFYRPALIFLGCISLGFGFIDNLTAEEPAAVQEAEQANDDIDENAKSDTKVGVTYSDPIQSKWKVGARIVGGAGAANNMLLTIPVPNDWPEQTVVMAEEDIPSSVGNVKFRELDSGVKQMCVTLPFVRAKEETIVTMTFLVTTSRINAPADTSVFERAKSNHKQGRRYLGVSPQINYRNSKLRKQVKKLVADKESVWQEIETLFDFVRDEIDEIDAEPSDVDDVFQERKGCREDKVGLFVAMCRAHKIPARMVWVEGTQYAEFMLIDSGNEDEDKEETVHWFPCNVVGIREFGSLADPRVIMQKGDSIRVPEKEARQKFVAEFATCTGKSKPAVRFIRELLPADE
jgi:hypothetical protein